MMDTARERAEEVFSTALEMKDPAERAAYLDQACTGDSVLRGAVEEMLSKQSEVERFFGSGNSVTGVAAEIVNSISAQPDLSIEVQPGAAGDEELGKWVQSYKLLERLGEGGCGVVYMAQQEVPIRRRVALKIIKLGMDTKSVIARFETERQALAMMDHPNIARVLDAGATETGRPFFVMELVRGMRITRYCDEKRLDMKQRLELFTQICHAIQHAHQKGIIHRDIKPSNILVTASNGVPVPKVIDFGIAKATGGQLLTDNTVFTTYEQFIGTPAYMSPEQADWSELDVDTRSDIYSLGVLLYELLTGRTPFDQKELLQSGLDSMRRILRDQDPPQPSTRLERLREEDLTQTALERRAEPGRLRSLLSGDLDWIVMKALEKDLTRRYQTANGLASDIRRFLNDEPVVARPPSRIYRLQKLVRRNRVVFAAGLAIGLSLMAGFGTSIYMFVRERQAREIANQALVSEAALRHEAEAQAKITQAAILISRNRFPEADALVEEVDLPIMKPSLEAAGVFRRLADWSVTEGRWESAAHHLLKLVQANQIDKTDMTDSATRELLKVGPALALVGDTNGYQKFIQETVARFARTTNAVAAEQVLKASTILPLDGDTALALKPLAQVVEKSLSGAPPVSGWEDYMCSWRAFALTRYAYRCGDYPGALAWGGKCLAYSDPAPTRIASAHALMAMASHKLGDSDQAEAALACSKEVVESELPPPSGEGLALGRERPGFWHDWIETLLLLDEASFEIEGTAPVSVIPKSGSRSPERVLWKERKARWHRQPDLSDR